MDHGSPKDIVAHHNLVTAHHDRGLGCTKYKEEGSGDPSPMRHACLDDASADELDVLHVVDVA